MGMWKKASRPNMDAFLARHYDLKDAIKDCGVPVPVETIWECGMIDEKTAKLIAAESASIRARQKAGEKVY